MSTAGLAIPVTAAVLAVLLALRRPPAPDADPHRGGAVAGTAGQDGLAPDRSRLRLRALAALGASAAVLVVVPGWYAVAVAGAAGGFVWWRSRGWEDRSQRRRRERLDADVLHVVDLLSAAVSAGASPAHALHEVTALSQDVTRETLGHWSRRLRWGSDPGGVWADMARHEQLGPLGQVLLRSAVSGAPVAEALVRLAEDERARHRGAVEARVRQIEARAAAPLGLCLLPAFVLLGIVPLVAGAVTGLVLG